MANASEHPGLKILVYRGLSQFEQCLQLWRSLRTSQVVWLKLAGVDLQNVQSQIDIPSVANSRDLSTVCPGVLAEGWLNELSAQDATLTGTRSSPAN